MKVSHGLTSLLQTEVTVFLEGNLLLLNQWDDLLEEPREYGRGWARGNDKSVHREAPHEDLFKPLQMLYQARTMNWQ